MLGGKHILLGVTGSIAAYKAANIVRLLVTQGAEVKIVMTPLAKQFITPLTLATLAKNPIYVDFFNPENGEWNSHVSLGMWADAYLIAPATANTIGKMANGIADNLLLTSYLSAKCPVFVAPAMDLDMFTHLAVQKNIETLKSYGVHFIDAEDGELASGLVGKGRLAAPERIVESLDTFFNGQMSLTGKKVMVTAGPTYEKIDAVRFIGNYSSGKMGYAIAEECASRGAEVVLVSGPTSLNVHNSNIKLVRVNSAREMYEACNQEFPQCNAAVLSAAVADFTPQNVSDTKIKRKDNNLEITLKPTDDIAASLGKQKGDRVLVGFALEKENELENAIGKLERKNFDFIVLNSMNDKGAGFNHDTNKITIINRSKEVKNYDLKSKVMVAKDIVDEIEKLLKP
ncbi:MAG: bifunctional phosphopantothenoylcysteine decarboxylase/phosphopantothenate--cysteine ligase CoaBC [Bacteroidales bacterium]|nr:bifunctional phosphopantothenoylcysteine decarboxylase/phosphopantothenate--cysteine ligase CoaBC [Bacteroidales bacterium]MBR6066879.1 bifunctional phosphopantothenoylcysteine decarboxylase/phosphopantothenate--cysteine ligase CoaBC [Bacteroidales bacterium]